MKQIPLQCETIFVNIYPVYFSKFKYCIRRGIEIAPPHTTLYCAYTRG